MRPRQTDVAVYGLLLVVLLAGAGWTYLRWQQQRSSGRAETLAQLLATSHAPRMTETPGVEAWLLGLLHDAGEQLPASERQAYERRLQPSGVAGMPEPMRAIADRLRQSAPRSSGPVAQVLESPPPPGPNATPVSSLRAVAEVQVGDSTLVMTRRRSLFEAGPLPSPLSPAAAHLVNLARQWPAANGNDNRLIRLYVIVEDGSFLSFPFPGGERSPEAFATAVAEETVQSQRRPRAPSLVTDSMFLEFDFAQPLGEQAHYSGVYADLAGSGFVASVSVPMVFESDGLKMIVAADVAIDIPLDQVLQAADPSMQLALTTPLRELRTPMWQPWTTLGTSLSPDAPAELRREVQLRANLEASENTWAPQEPVVHHTPADGRGVLLALQVSRRHWLVGWLVQSPAPMPWVPMLFAPAVLLVAFVWARRRGHHLHTELDRAQSQLRERHGVLDLLHLPLVVVDPNEDRIVHANAAAAELGVVTGRVFHEHLVAEDTRSQERYQQMQVLEGGRRRAYGVYLRGGGDTSEPARPRFALIRSVSLERAHPGLHAAAHQRLGLVCAVDRAADLAHLLDDHIGDARQDERNKLAAIINHGADTLARVLAHLLSRDRGPELSRWLADYLLRRLHVSQWVLDHWSGPVSHNVECILGPEHLRGALTRYEQIFDLVSHEPELRSRLHWHNGTLASAAEPPNNRLETWIDWTPGYRLTTPADGLFGYLLGEALVNAIKYGTPGQPIQVEVDLDRGRRELTFCIRNQVSTGPRPTRQDKAYGGLAIATELARVCGWNLEHRANSNTFELRWTCPVTQQRPTDQVD